MSVIIQFYQRCSDRFQDVVSRKNPELTETRLLVSARWAQLENLTSCLGKLLKAVREIQIVLRTGTHKINTGI